MKRKDIGLQKAIELYLKEQAEEREWNGDTGKTIRSFLVNFHKLKMGLPCGRSSASLKATAEYWKSDHPTPLADIGRDDVARYMTFYKATASINSQRVAKTHLLQFFDWLLDGELIDLKTNPVRKFKTPAKGKSGREVRAERVEYTDEQIAEILTAAKEQWEMVYYLILLMLVCDKRRSEMATIQWKNVDLDNGVATFWDEKNDRWVKHFMTPESTWLFKTYRNWYEGQTIAAGLGKIPRSGEWFLFCKNKFLGRQIHGVKRQRIIQPAFPKTPETIGDWVKKALQASGHYVPGQVCHVFRHEMTNRIEDTMMEKGYNNPRLYARMAAGHTSDETIAKNYRRTTTEEDIVRAAFKHTEFLGEEFRKGIEAFDGYGEGSDPNGGIEELPPRTPDVPQQRPRLSIVRNVV